MSNDVPICQKKGLHSLRLLPHFTALKTHLDSLEAMPLTSFAKPPHLGPLTEGYAALEDACNLAFGAPMKGKGSSRGGKDDQDERRLKIRVGYERLTQTLWRVAREFDVRGYGSILREKLTNKWCDCGCSTDHLSEVCERTVRDGEETAGLRAGKGREWDGRGKSLYSRIVHVHLVNRTTCRCGCLRLGDPRRGGRLGCRARLCKLWSRIPCRRDRHDNRGTDGLEVPSS